MIYNQNSRTKNTIKNISFTVADQVIKEVLAFVVRTVFAYTLATEYLGVNGLFTNILSFLSLAEMGVGSAMIFSMYKPMAEHEIERLNMYMDVYKKVYLAIGTFVLTIGLSLTPFLDFFMKERPNIPYLELIYVLYVFNTGATYFFAYKGSIFNADQRAYVVANNTTLFTVIQSIVRIIVLVTTHNFVLYLALSIVVVYVQNFNIARKADKAYPFIKVKTKKKFPEKEFLNLKKNIGALMMHKVGSVVLNSSDNLIISKLIGVLTVGLYSNYSLIINAIKTTFDLVIGSVGTSIGNLCATESDEKIYEVHNSILMLTIWGAGFCAISLCNLLNPFMNIWLGDSYMLSFGTVLAVTFSFYIQCTMRASEMFKSASGLFWNDRFAPLLQCIINVVVSIVLAVRFDITGIFIGTSIAMLLTKFWITPYVLFKYRFSKPLRAYFAKFMQFSAPVFFSWILTAAIMQILPPEGILCFILKMFICVVLPNTIIFLTYCRMKEFRYCVNLLLRGKIPASNE